MREISEETLIERAKKGSETAFASLMEKYETQVYHVAYAVLQNREDAEDASQETFLKVWKTLTFFRGESRFSTWLFRVAKNTALDYAAYRSRREALSLNRTDPETGEESETELADTDVYSIPEDAVMTSETVREVREAMALLSPEHRLILTLREFDSLSYQEIGERIGLDIGTVKSRINRAKNNFKKILTERNFLNSAPSNGAEKKCESFSYEGSDPGDL